LVDLGRRRVLLGLVLLEVLLVLVLGLANQASAQPVLVETFALFLALIIGACAFRPELESGAVELLWSKPMRRSSYALGKLVGGAGALLAVVLVAAAGSLPLAAILGDHPRQLSTAFALAWANAGLVMLAVMLISTRLNGPVSALLGFVIFEAAGAVTAMRALTPALPVRLLYDVLPHRLSPAWIGPIDLAGWAFYVAILVWLLYRELQRLRV
jgi:ABC-type transport system involved in multi-copper enzyme maturation permease subunit